MNRQNNQNIKPFSMFICSLLPGCAHMYLGLMKRGIQLLLAFLLLIGLGSTVNLQFILIPVTVVLYVYSFFDGYSIFRNIKSGKNVEDENIIEGLDSVKKIITNGYWIGLILVIFGLIIVLQNILSMDTFKSIAYYYYKYFSRFIPAALLFVLGVFLMVKGNKNRKKDKEARQKDISE